MPFNGEEQIIASRLIIDRKRMEVNSSSNSVYRRVVNECQNINPSARPAASEIIQWLRDYVNNNKGFAKVELVAAESNIIPQRQLSFSASSKQVVVYPTIESQRQLSFSMTPKQIIIYPTVNSQRQSGSSGKYIYTQDVCTKSCEFAS